MLQALYSMSVVVFEIFKINKGIFMSLPDINTLSSVVYQFFRGLDSRNNEAVANLIARKGVWIRQGVALQGPDAVRQALEQRDPERQTAHLVTNLWVEQSTESTARVHFYMTAFETKPDTPEPQMLGVRDSIDELVLEDGFWRIARKESRRILPHEA